MITGCFGGHTHGTAATPAAVGAPRYEIPIAEFAMPVIESMQIPLVKSTRSMKTACRFELKLYLPKRLRNKPCDT